MDALRSALEELNIPWRDDSVLLRCYVEGKLTMSLRDLLWISSEMNYLITMTQFKQYKKEIYNEIASGPFIAKRGLVSERAKKRALEDAPEQYELFRATQMAMIDTIVSRKIE